MPKSKRRSPSTRARATKVAQAQAAKKKVTPQQYAWRRAIGWTLVIVGIVAGVTHWGAHLGVLYDDRPLWDLLIGYPTAGLFGIGGAVVLSR